MNADFYAILGVSKSASQAEIKSAYVRLSKALHPDVNPNGAALMQQVNEAYEVLGDAGKRAAYDANPVRPPRAGAKVHPMDATGPRADAYAAAYGPGTIDLTKLAQAFVPPHVYQAAGPALERALEDRGITPAKASVEQLLESFGLLKKKRGAKKSA
jgi:curved DNA-binding protein CbpA